MIETILIVLLIISVIAWTIYDKTIWKILLINTLNYFDAISTKIWIDLWLSEKNPVYLLFDNIDDFLIFKIALISIVCMWYTYLYLYHKKDFNITYNIFIWIYLIVLINNIWHIMKVLM